MKKFLVIAVLAVTLTALCGCGGKTDYYSFVSQERRDVLFGESENYAIKCYSELREKPFKPDGQKQEIAYAVIIKLTVKSGDNGVIGGAKVTFSTDREYSALFTFHRESDDYIAISYVSSLPDKSLSVTVEAGGETETLKLDSILDGFAFSPEKALDLAISAVGNEFEPFAESGEMEINIRLVAGDGIFYYVGIITKDKTEAFLIDRDCERIVARKTLSN